MFLKTYLAFILDMLVKNFTSTSHEHKTNESARSANIETMM